MSTIQTFNILVDTQSLASRLFYEELDKIQLQNFKLKNNYLGDLNLDSFLSFDVAVLDNQLVAFAGMQIRPGIFPNNYARIGTRLYVSPAFRRTGLKSYTGLSSNNYLGHTELANPSVNLFYERQIGVARSAGLAGVFYTRYSNNWNVADKHVEYINTTINGTSFKTLPNIYNVCGDVMTLSCWQYVGAMSFDNRNVVEDFNSAFALNVPISAWCKMSHAEKNHFCENTNPR